MAKASDNEFPKIVLAEQGSTPSTPAAGTQKLFIDDADHKLKMVNESDVVTEVGDSGGGGGSLVFLESHIASTSATLDFTLLDDAYNDYLLKITGLVPSSSANNLIVRFATDATPTWDAGNNYRWFRWYWSMAAASGVTADGGATSNIQIAASVATTSGHSVNADIHLSNLRTAALYKSINSRLEQLISSDGNLYGINTIGMWVDNTHKAYGIRLLMSSGNIASGAAYLYGIKDS